MSDIVQTVAEVLYEHRGDKAMPHRYPIGSDHPYGSWPCQECETMVDDTARSSEIPPCTVDWRKPLHFARYIEQAKALSVAELLVNQQPQ